MGIRDAADYQADTPGGQIREQFNLLVRNMARAVGQTIAGRGPDRPVPQLKIFDIGLLEKEAHATNLFEMIHT